MTGWLDTPEGQEAVKRAARVDYEAVIEGYVGFQTWDELGERSQAVHLDHYADMFRVADVVPRETAVPRAAADDLAASVAGVLADTKGTRKTRDADLFDALGRYVYAVAKADRP